MAEGDLRVCALYPDLMNIYADRGNMAVLTQRAAWRGHELEVRALGATRKVPFEGGGAPRTLLATSVSGSAWGAR